MKDFYFIFNYIDDEGEEREVTSVDMEEACTIWSENVQACYIVLDDKNYKLDEDDFNDIYDEYWRIRKLDLDIFFDKGAYLIDWIKREILKDSV